MRMLYISLTVRDRETILLFPKSVPKIDLKEKNFVTRIRVMKSHGVKWGVHEVSAIITVERFLTDILAYIISYGWSNNLIQSII